MSGIIPIAGFDAKLKPNDFSRVLSAAISESTCSAPYPPSAPQQAPATIHKSHGSEYPAAIIPLPTQHYAMLQRNLLYTGVTRGKRLEKKAVAIAVRNVSGQAAVVEVGRVAASRDAPLAAVRHSGLSQRQPDFWIRTPLGRRSISDRPLGQHRAIRQMKVRRSSIAAPYVLSLRRLTLRAKSEFSRTGNRPYPLTINGGSSCSQSPKPICPSNLSGRADTTCHEQFHARGHCLPLSAGKCQTTR